MTLSEFSDLFDTLLNSYNLQSQFGEGASKGEITLDEYEKSVLLTQALDLVVKSYFTANLNQQGQGFDTSERRQIDFSSLITNESLYPMGITLGASSKDLTYFTDSNQTTESTNIRVHIQTDDIENLKRSITIVFTKVKPAYVTSEDWANMVYTLATDDNLLVVANFSDTDKPEGWTDDYTVDYLYQTFMESTIKTFFNTYHINFDFSCPINYSFVLEDEGDNLLTKSYLLSPIMKEYNYGFDNRGILYQLPSNILYILNEKFILNSHAKAIASYGSLDNILGPNMLGSATQEAIGVTVLVGTNPNVNTGETTGSNTGSGRDKFPSGIKINKADDDASGLSLSSALINHGLRYTDEGIKHEYVVKPINYREYDREMSKAYAQPLKKQMWRLFSGELMYDIISEIIPTESIAKNIQSNEEINYEYRIRYIRRPDPIVLVDLPDGLTIDGVSEASECKLNSILHEEILTKAVELALTTRGARNTAASNNKGSNRED